MPKLPLAVQLVNGLSVGSVSLSGNMTPGDAVANPSSLIGSEDFLQLYDQTQGKWYMARCNEGVLFAQVFNNQAVLDSTTAFLGSAGTYTGAAKTCGAYGRIVGSIYSDQAGTAYIEQSQDGANWDISQSVAITAATAANFSIEVQAPNCRLRIVNGATAQTVLRAYMNGRSI